MGVTQIQGLTSSTGLSGFSGLSGFAGVVGVNSGGISKLNLMFGGQSLAEYYFTRGNPRHSVFLSGLIKSSFGLGGSSTFTTYSSGSPIVVSNGASKTDEAYTVRLVNAASGGSALLDTSSSGSQIASGNYWWNTQDNSATSPGGALENTPSTPGPLWRAMLDYIDTYDLDGFVWSQGQTDAGANMTTYETVLRALFAAVRTRAGNSSLPIYILHIKDGNVASEANIEALAKVQSAIALDTDYVFVVQEYASQFAIAGSLTTTQDYLTGATKIYVSDTSGIGVNHRVSGTGIVDPSYVTSIGSDGGGSFFNIDNATTTGAITGTTLYRWDNTHPYEGADGVEPVTGLDTVGFNEIARRLNRSLVRWYRDRTSKRIFGPDASSVSVSAGSYTADIAITHDEGTDLAKYDGNAIDLTASNIMRFESKGVVITPTAFAKISSTLLRATFASPIPSGSFKFWPAYGAMNRKTLGNMIMDNAAQKLPLFRKSPDLYPALSITVSPVARGPLSDIGLSNLEAQWDATLSSSYSGSGTALNTLVSSPASGASASDYNLTLSGMSFSGSAGDAAAYLFSTAGAGFAENVTNTAFLRDMHKTTGGSDYTIVMAYRPEATTAATLFSTASSATNNGLMVETTTQITHRQGYGGASTPVSGGTVAATTWYLVIVTHSHSTNRSRRWLNTVTGSEQVHTFNTTTTDATGNLHLFSRTDGASLMPTNSRFAGGLLMNTYIDDGMANFLFDYYNTLHGRTYA
jgi:hypothetical protein